MSFEGKVTFCLF